MKRVVLCVLLSLIVVTGFSQSRLADVVCVYIHTPKLDSSVSVYGKLGFPVIAYSDFPSPWAQVSDGSLLIMLRKDPKPYIGLTYYLMEVDKVAGVIEKNGVIFSQRPKDSDTIRRYYFKSPDGFNIMLVANLGNFQQPVGTTLLTMRQEDYSQSDKYPNKLCGVFGEFSHPVKDLATSVEFWQKIGFQLKYQVANPYPHAILSDGLIIVGLHQTNSFSYPAITYFGIDTEKRIEQLKQKGLTNSLEMQDTKNAVLKTWEGQHFFLYSMGM